MGSTVNGQEMSSVTSDDHSNLHLTFFVTNYTVSHEKGAPLMAGGDAFDVVK